MTTTELITPPRPAAPADRTFREMVLEAVTLFSAVPLYGPPVVLLVGPLVLVALMVAGAFTALLSLVAVLVAATGLVGLVGAILASPYLLARRLSRRRSSPGSRAADGAQLVPVDWRRVVA